MTTRHPTVGGKGKRAADKPPKVKPVTYVPMLDCACGKSHPVHGINDNTSLIIIPCQCGALLRWTPNKATIEVVEQG